MASVFRKTMTHYKLNLLDSPYRLDNNLCILLNAVFNIFMQRPAHTELAETFIHKIHAFTRPTHSAQRHFALTMSAN